MNNADTQMLTRTCQQLSKGYNRCLYMLKCSQRYVSSNNYELL